MVVSRAFGIRAVTQSILPKVSSSQTASRTCFYKILYMVHLVKIICNARDLLMTPYTTRKNSSLVPEQDYLLIPFSYAATRGLFYSHMGWIFYKPTYERMELIERDDLDKDPGP